jgi:YidC/Oxa1 family membrane protein insertase
MGKKILQNVLTFMIIFMVIQLVFGFFNKESGSSATPKGSIGIESTKQEYGLGALVQVTVENQTAENIEIPSECPAEPLSVFQYINGEWKQKTATPEIKCSGVGKTLVIAAGQKAAIAYDQWNHALFGEKGRYKVQGTFAIKSGDKTEEKKIDSNEFNIVPASIFRFIWEKGFYQPIYNILMFFVGTLPGHNLGWAIIFLTILIRLVLLIPSQKGLKSQKRMQEVQPKLEEIKEKYKGNQQKIAEETMKIWKENKINPFGSCLPILMQLPILIALFNVVQSGLNPDNAHLLYGGFITIKFSEINILFTPWLDLTKNNTLVLPLIVGILQFIQMKMMFLKQANQGKKSETAMVNNTMLYVMPVMIALFTASTPAGVGIYWLTSTLFGIIQQYFVNKPAKSKHVVIDM